MSAASQVNLSAGAAWQDVTQTYAAASNADVLIQNQGPQPMRVVFGGATAPAITSEGVVLRQFDTASGNAANVWVLSPGGTTFSVTVNAGNGGADLMVGGSAVTNANPVPVAIVSGGGSGGANNAVSGTNALAPAYAAEIGVVDAGGNLRPVGGAVFHNADNQSLGGSQFGLVTGGITQILNAAGNLDRVREGYGDTMAVAGLAGGVQMLFNGTSYDRQRETGFDGIPAVGVATGTQQLAGPPLTTTLAQAVTGSTSAQTVTLTAVAWINSGVTTALQPGSALQVDTGSSQEVVNITAVNTAAKTVTGVFSKSHASGAAVTSFAYSQARDGTVPDGSAANGIASNITYLWNGTSLGIERARSAAGELDGASGVGTSLAAGYEFNSGGPVTNSGTPSGLAFDRDRNLQGKGLSATTLSAAVVAGTATITVGAVAGLLPGAPIRLDRNQAAEETAYVSANYTPGSLTVALQSALANAHNSGATAEWDVFASGGPGLNGFNATGIGIDEEVIYDPVSGKYFIERSATQDGVSGQNVAMEADALWNGTGFDRPRSVAAAQGSTGIGVEASGMIGLYQPSYAALTAGQMGQVVIDASGNQKVVGSGSAGTPAGGVLTVQGVSGGTALPVSGTVTATIGSALPAGANAIGSVTVTNLALDASNNQQVVGNVAAGATDSGNGVKVSGVCNAALPTYATGQRGDLQLSTKGILAAAPSAIAVTGADAQNNAFNTFGAYDGVNTIYFISRAQIFNGSTWDRVKKPSNTARLVASAASTNATSVKATSGDLFGIDLWNTAAAARYLKIYNLAAAPTVGTSTPVLTYYLPAGARFVMQYPTAVYFSNGIAYALTANAADTDTTAVAAGDIVTLNFTFA